MDWRSVGIVLCAVGLVTTLWASHYGAPSTEHHQALSRYLVKAPASVDAPASRYLRRLEDMHDCEDGMVWMEAAGECVVDDLASSGSGSGECCPTGTVYSESENRCVGTSPNPPSFTGCPTDRLWDLALCRCVLQPTPSPSPSYSASPTVTPSAGAAPSVSPSTSPSPCPSTPLGTCNGEGVCFSGLCVCNAPYAGPDCDMVTAGDPCVSTFCGTGGLCVPNSPTTATCTCVPGYTPGSATGGVCTPITTASYYWSTSEWSECDKECGTIGDATRTLECHEVTLGATGAILDRVLADTTECEALGVASIPAKTQPCNRFSCGDSFVKVNTFLLVDLAAVRDNANLLAEVETSLVDEISTVLSVPESRVELVSLDPTTFALEFNLLPPSAASASSSGQDLTAVDLANVFRSALANSTSAVYSQGTWLRRVDSSKLDLAPTATDDPEDKHHKAKLAAIIAGTIVGVVIVGYMAFLVLKKDKPLPKSATMPGWKPGQALGGDTSVEGSGGQPKRNRSERAMLMRRGRSAQAISKEPSIELMEARRKSGAVTSLADEDSAWTSNPVHTSHARAPNADDH